MRQSGATLVEVGTTNRTYSSDYESAINSETAAILKVHPSNFVVDGFTHAPELKEIVAVGKRHGVPVLNDLGSGCLIDTRKYGLKQEPQVQSSISDGAIYRPSRKDRRFRSRFERKPSCSCSSNRK